MSEKKLRDVLFTPWRFLYIKKGREPSGDGLCVFCEAVKLGAGQESLILHCGTKASVILNKYPYNNGHVMIIPHAHVSDLLQLDDATNTEMQSLLKKTYAALKDVYKPTGFNMGMNIGRTGGAGIAEHLHSHIVPRWDGDTNFMPIVAGTKVVSESPEITYNKLKPYFV